MKLYQTLAALQAAPNATVAHGGSGVLRAEDWLAQVARWRAAISARPASIKVAVFLADSAEFAAAVFALWSCGREVWLAPNNLPATTGQLQDRVDDFVGEFPALTPDVAPFAPAADALPLPAGWCLPAAARLVLFTSGSSGEPKQVAKQLCQLAFEVEQLERQFGGALGCAPVLATVSHQHIYGLLFRVLWPLAAGRPFARQTLEFLEDLLHVDLQAFVLVSSPTHLARLPQPLAIPAGRTKIVFSSGAPLSARASYAANSCFGSDILEVLGSTETGGIGWRIQHAQGACWQPFEVVQVKPDAESVMLIRSPFLAADDWYRSADVIRLQGTGFELLGRADRIVKIEGKRVALEQLERTLLASPWVQDVRVQPVSRSSQVAERDELVVLLVLSPTGARELATEGRKQLVAALSQLLAQVLERPLRPRRWRFLGQLPRNSQGKMRLADLDALIAGQPQAE
ncbi:acyl--CoA ligase [Simiduia sp. 21SJ11W-1]|uniref:AMP-binding protein n=1 Tax=Simiduia sp. 21SJ11W-1 TaxID=2909669 RepID=UPI00209EAF86|nr:class I adenylate-forming enzyme family protein [Simiduia sp. 21SJ11W-1]UTA48718.1 acyl--CoA ligase [Simiduia sp. 21SJ11W-1]